VGVDMALNVVKIIAHRGDSKYYPENRSDAFVSARLKGAHILETDLHRTNDDKIVLNHDDTVDYGFGMTAIKGMSSQEFLKLEGALTFDVFLHRYPNLLCNVDFKDKDPWLVDMAVRTIRKRKAADRVIVSSFFHANLKYFRKLFPECETSMSPKEVILFYLSFKLGLRKNRPHRIKYYQVCENYGPLKLVSPELIEYAHGRGVFVQPWTINDKKDMIKLINWGVDGIFTDDPGLLAEVLNQAGSCHENTGKEKK
jgi:glycerophosphoryl diester phosphodiesterase